MFDLISRPARSIPDVVHQTTGEDESDQLKGRESVLILNLFLFADTSIEAFVSHQNCGNS